MKYFYIVFHFCSQNHDAMANLVCGPVERFDLGRQHRELQFKFGADCIITSWKEISKEDHDDFIEFVKFANSANKLEQRERPKAQILPLYPAPEPA